MLAEQLAHARIAAAGTGSAHDDGDHVSIAAVHRGDEIEAGGADVAGLDAIDPFNPPEQTIVVADPLAAEAERAGREILVVAREALLDRASEDRLVAGRGDLLVVRQAGRVLVYSAAHAERSRLLRHQIGEVLLVAGNRFGDHDGCVVGRSCDDALDRVLDQNGATGLQSKLGRRLRGGVLGHFERTVEPELAGFELLEQQVERHDLGERSRMTPCVGIRRVQDGARICVDHDRRVGRRIGWITRPCQKRHRRSKAEQAATKPLTGFGPDPQHGISPVLVPTDAPCGAPTPLSCRGTSDWTF